MLNNKYVNQYESLVYFYIQAINHIGGKLYISCEDIIFFAF